VGEGDDFDAEAEVDAVLASLAERLRDQAACAAEEGRDVLALLLRDMADRIDTERQQ